MEPVEVASHPIFPLRDDFLQIGIEYLPVQYSSGNKQEIDSGRTSGWKQANDRVFLGSEQAVELVIQKHVRSNMQLLGFNIVDGIDAVATFYTQEKASVFLNGRKDILEVAIDGTHDPKRSVLCSVKVNSDYQLEKYYSVSLSDGRVQESLNQSLDIPSLLLVRKNSRIVAYFDLLSDSLDLFVEPRFRDDLNRDDRMVLALAQVLVKDNGFLGRF